jgi:hypothetical protein
MLASLGRTLNPRPRKNSAVVARVRAVSVRRAAIRSGRLRLAVAQTSAGTGNCPIRTCPSAIISFSSSSGRPMESPMRIPAMPKIFENVRKITTSAPERTKSMPDSASEKCR